jgi:hypothetical protein
MAANPPRPSAVARPAYANQHLPPVVIDPETGDTNIKMNVL